MGPSHTKGTSKGPREVGAVKKKEIKISGKPKKGKPAKQEGNPPTKKEEKSMQMTH